MFIETKNLLLRPVELTDAEMLRNSINHIDARKYLGSYLPQTICSEEEWIQKIVSDEDSIALITIDRESGKEIGLFSVHIRSWKDRTCTTGANIWNKDFRGKGYGFEAKMHFLYYIFMDLNMRKVCSSAISYNERSIAYQKKTGAEIEGVLKKQVYKNGEYYDEILLSVFKENFLNIWKGVKDEIS